MGPKTFFEMLGTPLKNHRWSWGGIRSADKAIFLRVWEDRKRVHEGVTYVKVTHRYAYLQNPRNPGYGEREEHVLRIQEGAPTYLVFCKAVDTKARPRTIESFNFSEVFPGGRMVELDGEMWMEVLPGVPVSELVSRQAFTA